MSSQSTLITRPSGIWLPLITPFLNGELDRDSLVSLVRHFSRSGITGWVLAGTTGEALTLEPDEVRALVEIVAEHDEAHLPIMLGLCGVSTARLVRQVQNTASWPIDGFLVTAPYYARPSQEGLYRHFRAIAEATNGTRPIVAYNIPYRTAVNMTNETILRLAEENLIVGIKDCSPDPDQSRELIENRPSTFSVLVGDDANFFRNIEWGADGGILASAHVDPQLYVRTLAAIRSGRGEEIRGEWDAYQRVIETLFGEPNPAPVKSWMQQEGLIASQEVRPCLVEATPEMVQRIALLRQQRRASLTAA